MRMEELHVSEVLTHQMIESFRVGKPEEELRRKFTVQMGEQIIKTLEDGEWHYIRLLQHAPVSITTIPVVRYEWVAYTTPHSTQVEDLKGKIAELEQQIETLQKQLHSSKMLFSRVPKAERDKALESLAKAIVNDLAREWGEMENAQLNGPSGGQNGD